MAPPDSLVPGILLAAITLDRVLGDPVYPWHPVRLMGNLVQLLEPWLYRYQKAGGMGLVFLGLLICLPLGFYLENLDPWWGMISLPLAYSLFGYGDLVAHVNRVAQALERKDLQKARDQVSFLVGRDTASMDEAAISRACLESLSENFSDGFLAPLFWFSLAGLPGLLGFKWVSTLDSMVGYKNERYGRYGFWAAKLDDVLNWAPARITWLVFALAAFFGGLFGLQALKTGYSEHHKLDSPNSGWPEAALAGGLKVRLLGPTSRFGKLEQNPWIGGSNFKEADVGTIFQGLRLTHLAWLLCWGVVFVVFVYFYC